MLRGGQSRPAQANACGILYAISYIASSPYRITGHLQQSGTIPCSLPCQPHFTPDQDIALFIPSENKSTRMLQTDTQACTHTYVHTHMHTHSHTHTHTYPSQHKKSNYPIHTCRHTHTQLTLHISCTWPTVSAPSTVALSDSWSSSSTTPEKYPKSKDKRAV